MQDRGGGKSIALLARALQYVHVPGYSALILRRTYQDLALPGAIMDVSHSWLKGTDAKWDRETHSWTFPSGAKLTFGYLDNDADVGRYKSSAFQFCVARGTPILMADRTWRSVESLRLGDMLATLNGPRRLTRLIPAGNRPLIKIALPWGSAFVSSGHQLLSRGAWASPLALSSTSPQQCHTSCVGSISSPRILGLHDPETPRGRSPFPSSTVAPSWGEVPWASDAWSTGVRSDSAMSGGSPLAPLQPPMWCAPVALLQRLPRLDSSSTLDVCRQHVHGHVPCVSQFAGSTSDCQRECGSSDGRSPCLSAFAQANIQQPSGVARHCQPCSPVGGLANTPAHNQMAEYRYFHPYTMEPQIASEGVLEPCAQMSPAGAGEVFDLTVEGASHYISWPGIISKNCGFDELTEFSEYQYSFLFSRLRAPIGLNVPWRMRSACVDEGDVLTVGGWRPIQDVCEGDFVYSMSPDGVLELKEVEATYRSEYQGDMVRVRKKNLYMSMTPDHRVVFQKFGKDTYDIAPWDQHGGSSIAVARAPKTLRPLTLSPADKLGWGLDLYLAFLGLFLAEGCTNSVPRRSNYKVVITQRQSDRAEVVANLMDRLPVRYNRSRNGDFQITNKRLWEHFRAFGKAHEKFVPRDVLAHADTEQLTLLLKWLVFGDGHVSGDSIVYVTVSPRLADDVSEIGVKLGYKVMVTREVLPNPNHNDRYTVRLTRNSLVTKVDKGKVRNDCSKERFEGEVFCIKVADNGNFVLRQRGTVWVSGNTNPGGPGHEWVQQRFLDAKQPDRLFIPALIEDNPGIDTEKYEKRSLSFLDPVTYERLRHGDWEVRPGGNMFKREWFRVVEIDDVPRRFARVVRYWDLAASDESKKDADYTAGCKMGYSDQTNKWYVLDMIRVRKDPGAVEALIVHTANVDGPECYIRMEQEPGASSEYLMRRFRRLFGGRFPFEPVRADRRKEVRARPASASAKAEDILLVRGPWVSAFLNEIVAFPNPKVHDDQVDAFSGAYMMLANRNSNMDALTDGLARLAGSTIHRPIPRRW